MKDDKMAKAMKMVQQNKNFGTVEEQEIIYTVDDGKKSRVKTVTTKFQPGTEAFELFQQGFQENNVIARELQDTEEDRASGKHYDCRPGHMDEPLVLRPAVNFQYVMGW